MQDFLVCCSSEENEPSYGESFSAKLQHSQGIMSSVQRDHAGPAIILCADLPGGFVPLRCQGPGRRSCIVDSGSTSQLYHMFGMNFIVWLDPACLASRKDYNFR